MHVSVLTQLNTATRVIHHYMLRCITIATYGNHTEIVIVCAHVDRIIIIHSQHFVGEIHFTANKFYQHNRNWNARICHYTFAFIRCEILHIYNLFYTPIQSIHKFWKLFCILKRSLHINFIAKLNKLCTQRTIQNKTCSYFRAAIQLSRWIQNE